MLAERPGSGDGEREALMTRQMPSEPLPASVLLGVSGRIAIGGEKLFVALGADPIAALVGVADTLLVAAGVVERPPADGAMVVAPTVRHEVNLGGVESLAVVERSRATDAMNQRRTPLPTLASPSVRSTCCNLLGNVATLPRGAVDENWGLGRHRIGWAFVHTRHEETTNR